MLNIENTEIKMHCLIFSAPNIKCYIRGVQETLFKLPNYDKNKVHLIFQYLLYKSSSNLRSLNPYFMQEIIKLVQKYCFFLRSSNYSLLMRIYKYSRRLLE